RIIDSSRLTGTGHPTHVVFCPVSPCCRRWDKVAHGTDPKMYLARWRVPNAWSPGCPGPRDGEDIVREIEPSAVAPAPEPSVECEAHTVPLALVVEARTHPRFERPLEASVRQVGLLSSPPWVRSLGKLQMDVSSQGWRFPLPPDQP